MILSGKPLWLEGMFLRPQHLQQYDRWIENSLERRIDGISAYGWGLREISFDTEALQAGQVRLTAIDGVFPDGTAFTAPSVQPLPAARRLEPDAQGKKLYLALPLRGAGGIEVAETEAENYRFRKSTTAARNSAQADRPPADILVGTLNVRLVIDGDNFDELVLLPIAEIDAVDAQGQITLSDTYIPPLMVSGASPRLLSIMDQIRGLLRSRATVLASGATGQGDVSRSAMLDLMTLGIANKYESLFTHLIAVPHHSAEAIYRDCVMLIGELSAFAASGRRPPSLPAYDHVDLRQTFDPVFQELRGMLSVVVVRNAVNIPLTEREYGIWLGEIEDRMIFRGRRLVLIAQADMALETIRTQMPIQIKIGPVEQIRELVNLQLPGIVIEALSVAPREIPFIQNAVYFELNTNNPLWAQMPNSAAFALHVSGSYPGLRLELWAIQAASS